MFRVVLVALLAACTPEIEGPPGACDPLVPEHCSLPYPSSFFLKEDASTETGFRVDFREGSLPTNRDDVPFDPTDWNERDGFSISGPMLVDLGLVSIEGVIGHEDLAAYAAADAKTAIVNLTTGERVPHFVEIDLTAEDPAERLLMLRPVEPLDWNTSYAVALRDLERPGGGAIEPSPAFLALRDGERTKDPDVERRRERFDEVLFPALEDAGFPRDELLLAWDFHTASRRSVLGKMEHIREDLYAALGDDGPEYTLLVADHDCATGTIARTLTGSMTVPLYMQEPGPGSRLTKGDDGLPYANGTTTVPFVVRIPCSLAEDPHPAMVVQYGHGLLGHRDEAKTGWLSGFADREGFVVVATDWAGMSEPDVPEITLMLAIDVSGFAMLPERSHQGYAQQLALTRLVKQALADDPLVKFVPPAGGHPVSVIDPGQVVYYGNSQGGIMGGALMGMSPDLERGVLGVSGGPYNLLLSRSADFDPFFLIFQNKYTDHRDITLILGLIQMQWDSSESAGWLHDLRTPPDAFPTKQVLIQNAIYDAQVTTLGGHFQARGIGAALIAPQTRPVFGLGEVEGPHMGSALVEWQYSDLPPEPVENVPPDEDHDPHECPRRDPAGQAQVIEFLTTGTISHHCDGPCVSVQATCQ